MSTGPCKMVQASPPCPADSANDLNMVYLPESGLRSSTVRAQVQHCSGLGVCDFGYRVCGLGFRLGSRV
jgi:hypothetical protein